MDVQAYWTATKPPPVAKQYPTIEDIDTHKLTPVAATAIPMTPTMACL